MYLVFNKEFFVSENKILKDVKNENIFYKSFWIYLYVSKLFLNSKLTKNTSNINIASTCLLTLIF
jgi:hypothetical protein